MPAKGGSKGGKSIFRWVFCMPEILSLKPALKSAKAKTKSRLEVGDLIEVSFFYRTVTSF